MLCPSSTMGKPSTSEHLGCETCQQLPIPPLPQPQDGLSSLVLRANHLSKHQIGLGSSGRPNKQEVRLPPQHIRITFLSSPAEPWTSAEPRLKRARFHLCFLVSINSVLAAPPKTITFMRSIAELPHGRGGCVSAMELTVKDGFGLNH